MDTTATQKVYPVNEMLEMETENKEEEDEPGRGCLPVRQFHKRDETKILPHVRRGLKLDD